MNTVYRLRDDPVTLDALRAASLSSERNGLTSTYGAVGSEAWWQAIAEGRLAINRVHGQVDGYWPGQHAGGPAELALVTPRGQTSTWLCELSPELATLEFRMGRRVAVEFIEPDLKHEYERNKRSRLTLSISLE